MRFNCDRVTAVESTAAVIYLFAFNSKDFLVTEKRGNNEKRRLNINLNTDVSICCSEDMGKHLLMDLLCDHAGDHLPQISAALCIQLFRAAWFRFKALLPRHAGMRNETPHPYSIHSSCPWLRATLDWKKIKKVRLQNKVVGMSGKYAYVSEQGWVNQLR